MATAARSRFEIRGEATLLGIVSQGGGGRFSPAHRRPVAMVTMAREEA
jgi:hypothetical protein